MEELIFGSGQHIEVWQECARALVIFIFGLLLIRLIGRRVFGKWSSLDIIVSIIVGSALGRTMTGGAPLWATLAAVALLMVLHWALARLAARYRIFSTILEGESIRLAQGGELDHRKMRSNNITDADLNEALRGKGLDELSAAKLVTVEPSGKISVLPKS